MAFRRLRLPSPSHLPLGEEGAQQRGAVCTQKEQEHMGTGEVIEFEFPEPTKPWSTNEDRQLNRYARNDRVALWKAVTQLGWASKCNREGRPRAIGGPSLVRVGISFATRRRRDPHNYCGTVLKAIVDGLVLAGAWPDDTHEYLEHLAPSLRVDTTGTVSVTILPRRDAYIPCDHGAFGSCPDALCGGGVVIEF